MEEHLFIYGTLKLPEVQLKIIGRTVSMVPDILAGFKKEVVVINGKEYFALVPSSHSETNGAVISVSKDELRRIDDYEFDEYKRVRVKTLCGTNAWAYMKA